ncbi:MAG: hypothetical protein V4501_07305 [Pseudomonadota bacterium]
MLSGTLSSTATALLNMTTETEVSPVFLQTADNSLRNWGIATALLIGLAIFCLRRPTPVQLIRVIHASSTRSKMEEKKAEPATTELTPLVNRQLSEHSQHPRPLKGVYHNTLLAQINALTANKNDDPNVAIEIRTSEDDFDLEDFKLDEMAKGTKKFGMGGS